MSSGSTYLEALIKRYDKYKKEDFFSLICCGTDLNNPYAGLAGICCDSVFGDFRFRSYFGDFPDSLMQYENVADFLIDRTKSKALATQQFFAEISAISKNPVFVSSNASTWALPALQAANEALAPLDRLQDFQVMDLRNLYSFIVNGRAKFSGEYIGSSMRDCPPVPRTFGLHRMAAACEVYESKSGTNAEQRSRITAALSRDLLERDFPERGGEDADD